MSTTTPNPFSPELLQPRGPLHAVMEASPIALIAVDREGRVRLANAEAERLSGRTSEEMTTLLASALVPPRLREQLTAFLEAFFAKPEGMELPSVAPQLSLLRKDGTEISAEVRLSPLTLGDQRFVLAAVTDLGSRRHARNEEEARLGRSRMQAETLIELVSNTGPETGDVTAGIRRLTELAASSLETDQASVWLLDDFGRTLVCSDLYIREKAAHATEQSLSRELFPTYFDAIEQEKSVAIEDTRTDLRVQDMGAYFLPRNILATLDAPIRMRGHVVGVVCLEHKGTPRVWRRDERVFAGSLADQAAQLLLNVEHAKATLSAREATDRLQEIFSNTTEAIFSVRVTPAKEFIYEEFNPAAATLSGVPSVKAYGRRPQDLFPPAAAAQVNGDYRRCLDEGRTVELIEDIAFGPGLGTFHTFLIPIRGEDGVIHRIAGFSRDVTEQKNAERALQISEEKFSKAFRSSPDAISVSDAETGQMMEVNEGFERLFGCKAAEIIGRTSRELDFWASPKDRDRLVHELKTKGSVKDFAATARPRSGPLRPCILSAERAEIAGRTCLVLVIRDVTEQRAAEKALRDSEARFRSYFESPLVGMAITSPDRRWLEVNDHLCEMLGYTREELQSMRWSDLTVEGDIEADVAQFERARAGEVDAYAREKRYRRKDGRIIHMSIAVRCIRTDGAADYFLTVLQDQTARVEAEQAQGELESQLRQAQKLEALGQLAGGIAHDFNNILTAIMAYTELAGMDLAFPDEARQHLDQVQKASNRARDLVRRILTFSRQRKQERRPVQLGPVVEEAVSLVRSTLPATIEIEVSVAPDVPVVLADLSQVHQVMMNLCTNSAYAMRERAGKLSITLERVQATAALVRAHPELRESGYARLTVADTGSGMTAEVVKRVFEPFFTTKGPGEGTGLGLSVVHGIMHDHEGAVTVESVVGRGTTFRMYFPEQIGVEETSPVGDSKVVRGGGERILFIDDEQALCDSTALLLEKIGYNTTAFTSPVAALERFRENPDAFDLVFTDLSMPFMTGMDLSREILAVRPQLPVILASGFGGAWTAEKVRAEGLRELLIKPVTAAALSATVRRVLDGKAR